MYVELQSDDLKHRRTKYQNEEIPEWSTKEIAKCAKEMEAEKRSLVLVCFGFMGSQPRHIQKYHALFADFKDSLVVHTVYPFRNYKDLMAPKQRLKSLGIETLQFLQTQIASKSKSNSNSKEPVVLFYVFSNAGSMLMATMNDLLCDQVYIDGIIYDSCPGLMRYPLSVSRVSAIKSLFFLFLRPTLNVNHINSGVHAMIPNNKKYPNLVRYFLFTVNYMIAVVLYSVYKLGLSEMTIFPLFFEKLLCERNAKLLGIPSLFLYSDQDKAIMAEHIEMFIGMKKKAMSDTDLDEDRLRTHNFKDSEHVAHYRKYPKMYRMSVFWFSL